MADDSQLKDTLDGEGKDAVCFTAGFSGALFGAGTIHAYLAARRANPQVAAGISMGALSAAAMQRCYQESMGPRRKKKNPRAGPGSAAI